MLDQENQRPTVARMRRREINWEKIRAEGIANAARDRIEHPERYLHGPWLPPPPPRQLHRYLMDHMPPDRLEFRNGVIVFEIVPVQYGFQDGARYQARRLNSDAPPVEIVSSPPGPAYIRVDLFQNGFTHYEGTPASALMAVLVRLGYAHVIDPKEIPRNFAGSL